MPSNKESKVLAKKYQKKTDREHILDAPDTYIGSVEQDEDIEWMLDEIILCVEKNIHGYRVCLNVLMKVWLIVEIILLD